MALAKNLALNMKLRNSSPVDGSLIWYNVVLCKIHIVQGMDVDLFP